MSQPPPAGLSWRPGAELTLNAGTIQIRLTACTLEQVIRDGAFDAVVSSDDAGLSMSGGVSKAIADLAGPAIRAEAALQVPLPVGSVAITGGGNLPVRYVLHGVTRDPAQGVLPSLRTIHQLVREVLTRCEALSVRSLAIPAIATGTAGFPAELSAGIVARALQEHALNPTCLQSVVLPVPDSSVREAFARELARPLLEDITAAGAPAQADFAPPRRASAPTAPSATTQPESAALRVTTIDVLRGWFSRRRRQPAGEVSTVTAPGVARTAAPAETLVLASSSRPVLSSRYVLLEELGRGGMAVVYMSWDLVLRRRVAIKVLRADTGDTESLRREASAALDLTHKNIVRMYHFEPGDRHGGGYLVMEYLPWPSGEKWVADAGLSGLPVGAIAEVGARISDAVAYAHSRNLLHLDIKPSNIFVDPGGDAAKLGDFGLARVSNAHGAAMQFRFAGTPAYMAPEQRQPGAKVTAATDVYQLGATLWDLLTGRPPRGSDATAEPPAGDRRALLGIARQALAPDPVRRPTAAALAEMVAATGT